MAAAKTPVYFSRHSYGYRATPGNALVARGGSVVFWNYSNEPVILRDFSVGWIEGSSAGRPQAERGFAEAVRKGFAGKFKSAQANGGLTLPPGADVVVSLAGLPRGQYFYSAIVGDTGLEAQGGSGPGIIINP
jgi:hypothetical protein